jgi:hypothetical protein
MAQTGTYYIFLLDSTAAYLSRYLKHPLIRLPCLVKIGTTQAVDGAKGRECPPEHRPSSFSWVHHMRGKLIVQVDLENQSPFAGAEVNGVFAPGRCH